MLITVFVVALLSAVVIGILQMITEDIQVMRNQIYAAEAVAIAEAGLNDAFAEIRVDSGWSTNINKNFNGGTYDVEPHAYEGPGPSDLKIIATGTSSQGFVARVEADVTIGTSSPYVIRIDALRINE